MTRCKTKTMLLIVLVGNMGSDCFNVETPFDGGGVPTPTTKLIMLRIVNESGLDAAVEATLFIDGNQVRSTTRLLAAEGAEASELVVPTQTDLIRIVAREADTSVASARVGDVLIEHDIVVGPDSVDPIIFIIPIPGFVDCNNSGVGDALDIADGTSQDCNVNGVPDECDIAAGTGVDVNGNGILDECESWLLVDDDAPPGGDGRSWATAFNDLQDGLAAAASSGGKIRELWVAAGVYKPHADDREVSFELLNGVAIRGGFAGNENPVTFPIEDRNFVANTTILSGNIGDTDNDADNSCHVLSSSDTVSATAILDGVTVAAGNANGHCSNGGGGGLYNDHGSPTLIQCAFLNNEADSGGGVYNDGGSPMLANCAFLHNKAQSGGGIYNEGSRPTLTDCSFLENEANFDGGGMYNAQSSPALTGGVFTGNTAACGGGIKNYNNSNTTLINSLFSGNSASSDGGGMYNAQSSPTLTNCTFGGNTADSSGGGMYSDAGTQTVTNCILYGNSDHDGTDESAQLDGIDNTPVVNHSCVLGWGGGGTGNIWDNPLFVRDLDPGSDGTWDGSNDDYGDLHLQAGSPCIDVGNNDADTDAIGAGAQPLPAADLGGGDRFLDDTGAADAGSGTPPIVDMGAYEFHGTTPPP